MALMSGFFNKKKKEIQGSEIRLLYDTISVDREPVIIQTGGFKFVSDIINHDGSTFQVKNNISRDEVLYHLKGHKLHIQIPYELTLYAGDTVLHGLGMVNGMHTLKFRIPKTMYQEEHRGAYRVSKFPNPPTVTFTSNQTDILRARLLDVSMTGAGIKVDSRYSLDGVSLSSKSNLIIDIRLTDRVRISTSAVVRYNKNGKIGLQFGDLSKGTKDNLFKFIVAQRKDEYRALIEMQQRLKTLPSTEMFTQATEKPVMTSTGKPTVLIAGAKKDDSEFLGKSLNRKFDIIYASPTLADIRNQCSLGPSLCLFELDEGNLEQSTQMKKASALLPRGCVLMFYGSGLSSDFQERFLSGSNWTGDVFVDVDGQKKLLIFKQIQRYYEQRGKS